MIPAMDTKEPEPPERDEEKLTGRSTRGGGALLQSWLLRVWIGFGFQPKWQNVGQEL
jgi:hypothetical protein